MRLFTSALLATAMVAAGSAYAEVTPVPRLDQARYLGRWHEIARLPMFFQRKCARDVTATYSLNADGTIRVHNACRQADGSEISAEGVARQAEPGIAAKLEVRFAPAWLGWLPLVWADYWVIALDPDYRWAMVGQPGKKYLWILSREPSLDRATFDMLKGKATGMGYDLAPLLVSGKVE
jgi:apolipoprotein D and lipocalin family protein